MNESTTPDALPAWKQRLWHRISRAAKARHVFDKADYDENGDFKTELEKFKQLHDWVLSRNHESRFGSIRPDWSYSDGDDRWELVFNVVDPKSSAAPAPDANGEVKSSRVVHRKHTSIFFEGHKPGESEWVVLHPQHDDDGILHEDMNGDGAGKHCRVM